MPSTLTSHNFDSVFINDLNSSSDLNSKAILPIFLCVDISTLEPYCSLSCLSCF